MPSSFRISLSVSPFSELVLSQGVVYTDGKTSARTTEDVQRVFMNYGANEVYARIATTRKYSVGFGDHSLERGIGRARMAKSLNLPFNPELGLFNIYGDVMCQPPPDFRDYPEIELPGPWVSLTIEQMLPALKTYGAIAAKAILDTGVKIRIWDLGNEVDFGMAGVSIQPFPNACNDTAGGPGWYKAPDAVDPEIGKFTVIDLLRRSESDRIDWLRKHVWLNTSKMFAAVAAGVRSVDRGARFSTHLSGVLAVRKNDAMAFYAAMQEGGFLPDELGFSFYPSSTDIPPDRLRAFQSTVTAVHEKFRRPVFVAEFGYPSGPLKEGPFATWNHAIDKYPITLQGQANLLRDFASWGMGAGLSGIRLWAPDLPMPAWESFSLFSLNGKTAKAKPALGAIAEGVAAKRP
jgi:arabinogalactan endo-1,4-beta-galactosidase